MFNPQHDTCRIKVYTKSAFSKENEMQEIKFTDIIQLHIVYAISRPWNTTCEIDQNPKSEIQKGRLSLSF